jgi:hypothetical protein
VALISGEAADIAQPLLSPLYYINRALSPYADLIEAETADMTTAVPELLRLSPAVIVLADIGTLPGEVAGPLNEWIERGGTLIRFAGPRLAAAPADDPLAPVLLRKGERELGGALSWIEPQPLADYPPNSPFAGLPTPRDVTVSTPGSGRTLRGTRSTHLGKSCRRNPAGHSIRAWFRPDRAVSCHRGSQLVDPADLRPFRRHAAPRRAIVPRRHRWRRGRIRHSAAMAPARCLRRAAAGKR